MYNNFKFFDINLQFRELFSTKSLCIAPRLIASMPNAPVQAYKSKTLLSFIEVPSIEKIANFTLWVVGRTPLALPGEPIDLPLRRPPDIFINYIDPSDI